MGEDPFLTTINFPWFFIYVILITFKLCRGMNGLSPSMVCILLHNDDNWDSLAMGQITNSINGNLSNVMIFNYSDVDMHVWRIIYDINFPTHACQHQSN